MRPGQILGPLIVIGIGMLLLLNNLGWHLPVGYVISRFWPMLLVGVGVAQIAGSLIGKGSLTAGIIVLTIGALFQIQQLWYISFGETWPVLLIAIGVIGLLRAVAGPALSGPKFEKGGGRR